MSGVELTTEQHAFLDEVHAAVTEYIDLYGSSLELRLINRRFGTKAKKLFGVPLKKVLRESGRFVLNTDNKFRTMVVAV